MALATIGLSGCGDCGGGKAVDAPSLSDAAEILLQTCFDHIGAPGVILARAHPREGIAVRALGKANTAVGYPMHEDDPMFIASISKTFTSAVVLQLIEEGALKLDDPLSKWRPDFPDASRITVRTLMDHTSGVGNFSNVPNYLSSRDEHWPVEDLVWLAAGHASDDPPGETYTYANTNYLLLGLIVEAVTGNRFEEELDARLLGPLGLEATYMAVDDTPWSGPVEGYGRDWQPRLDHVWPANSWTSGSIVSTAEDTTRWALAVYGGDVLTQRSLDRMIDEYERPLGWSYGLGVNIYHHHGHLVVGHGGTWGGGMRARMYYDTEVGSAVVVLLNRSVSDRDRIAEAALWVLARR
jgi:D-alanyl-D-alanine carboxypeptidase